MEVMKLKVQKGDKIIEVTEKAYRVVYAPLGFTPVKEGGKRGQNRSKKDPSVENDEA